MLVGLTFKLIHLRLLASSKPSRVLCYKKLLCFIDPQHARFTAKVIVLPFELPLLYSRTALER